ncbi:DUF3413 domain-containing protein [Psychrosphaera saromensis]|uniref:Inner membrane protein YejM N-terminal domain-containing protein n=1 Tax=Psychrosphaera saromensis TaxID=716813 RepID=A0A2S7UXP3_9GAMM|nr:DUF3413 domain-containing protein [Psychrosphaera saromensis]PQJ54041.1 hypothetical protein BTO11_10535 [Psychrosphaera saromensis]
MIKIPNLKELDRPFNLLSWGHWFTFANILLALLFSFFYLSPSQLPETFLGWLYLGVNWVGHFSFLAISCFILTIFPIIALFPHRHHIRGLSSVMATLFQTLLFLDVLSFRSLGYHLSATSLVQLREVEDFYIAHIGNAYWLLLLCVFVAILAYQFFVSNMAWKRIHQLQNFKYKNAISTSLVSIFFISHMMHMWSDATLNSDIAKQNNIFPVSYPLTARTLLAKYELIDLNKYNTYKSKQADVTQSGYTITPFSQVSCDVTDKDNLSVHFVDITNFFAIKDWLNKFDIDYQSSYQLNIPADFDTAMFNFTTGLPGLYNQMETQTDLEVNHQFNANKIAIEVHAGTYDIEQQSASSKTSRVYVFYDKTSDLAFYRGRAILVGFKPFNNIPIAPQNIVASYIKNQLDCPQYVEENLIDSAINDIEYDYIFTNFYKGLFSIVYKDKSMLFEHGQLISNVSFSNAETVKEPLDLQTIQAAITKLTSKRIKLVSKPVETEPLEDAGIKVKVRID